MYRIRIPVSRPPRRLLIVSASEALLFPTVRYFSERGFRVDCTRCLERAASLVANVPYAAVLVQLGLAGADRREWIEQLERLLQHVSRETLVLLTADNSPTVDDQVFRWDLSARFDRPVPPDHLADVVAAMLRGTPESSSDIDDCRIAPPAGERSR